MLPAKTYKQSAELQDDEEKFCRAWIDRRQNIVDRLVYLTAVVVFVAIGAVLQIVPDSSLVRQTRVALGVVMLTTLLGYAFRKNPKGAKAALFTIAYVTALASCWVLYHATRDPGQTRDIVLVATRIMAFGVFTPLICPYKPWVIALYAVGYSALATAITWSIPMGIPWGIGLTMAIFTAFGFRQVVERRQWAEARREYRFRLMVVPEHIARQSAAGMAEVFRPEEKFCVCLSSDWRNYQELCSSLSATDLTRALNGYYDACKRLLQQTFVHGNYFSDWIADELFIVVYPVDGQDANALVDQTFAFALSLLEAKRSFAAVHRLPRAIDIGMASGQALLGLMGPRGYRKATALGAVPLRARNLQSVGKILRRNVEDADHVVLGADCRGRLSSPGMLRAYCFGEREVARNLVDREVYYLSASKGVARSHG
jgi:class 3 adenylate cyclase